MLRNHAPIFSFLLLAALAFTQVSAQTCTAIGQNPGTAFPVCGTSVFNQLSVPTCGGTKVPGPCAPIVDDRNPYWYKFTCFKSGTLGFVITPKDLMDDYDWQIFDITGQAPEAVYTNASLFVTCNWSGETGKTGAGPAGTNLTVCDGLGKNVYSQMATLSGGRTYLLLISHFTNSQSGYGLSFGGGTASITDSTPPKMQTLVASCDGKTLGIRLNKKMKCNSISSNGSEFTIAPANASIIGAVGIGCSSGFDTDSLVLTLDKPLTAGTYQVGVKNGTDGNGILDNCDNAIPDTNKLSIAVLPAQPTPMDSIKPVLCKPTTLQLVFRNPMLCSSIAADGSDFSITGPSVVNISGATGNCTGGVSSVINIQLSAPIQTGGVYTVRLKKGTDGNTLFNQCTKETPEGSTINFTAYDVVVATLASSIRSSCIEDTLFVSNPGGNGINSWTWVFDDGIICRKQDTSRVYNSGTHSVMLTVSNGVCSDSSKGTFSFDKNRVKAAFTAPAFACPLDTARFADSSTGPVTSWFWDFGNGQTSSVKTPPYQFYPTQTTLQVFTAWLKVSSANGCLDSTSREIQVPGNCYIAVPTAFTPNGDGLNDYLYPLNAYKAVGLEFKVYNRFGQMVWHTTDWTRKWNGAVNGTPQSSGTYVWHLSYTDGDKGTSVKLHGTCTLIR